MKRRDLLIISRLRRSWVLVFASLFLVGLIPCIHCLSGAEDDVRGDSLSSLNILGKCIDGMGGVERINNLTNLYVEGTVDLLDGKMTGVFREWTCKPCRIRIETVINEMTNLIGSDGVVNWSLDQHGNLDVRKADRPIRNDTTRMLIELIKIGKSDGHSPISMLYCGKKEYDGVECHVVELPDSLNGSVFRMVFEEKTLLLRGTEYIIGDNLRKRCFFRDYRPVAGVKHPFMIEKTSFRDETTEKKTISDIRCNVDMPSELFKPPEPQPGYRFSNGCKAEGIDFRLVNGLILLACEIGGKATEWILDSGANATLVFSSQCKDLELKKKGSGVACAISKTLDVFMVEIPSFSLPGVEFAPRVVTAIPGDMGLNLKGSRIAGLLGYDFVSRFVVKIDYRDCKVSFFDPLTFSYSGSGCVIPCVVYDRLMLVTAVLDHEYRADWILDTGASVTHINHDFASRHKLLAGLYDRQKTIIADGTTKENAVKTFNSLRIGEKEIVNPLIQISTAREPEWFARPVAGHIGASVLTNFVVYFDYSRSRIILE